MHFAGRFLRRQQPAVCPQGREHYGQTGALCGRPTAGYASANQPFALPGGDQLILTTGCDVARTGEVFCDDPIAPDVVTDSPLEDALEWIGKR